MFTKLILQLKSDRISFTVLMIQLSYIFFLKCLFEHPEYMFIYLEGKYNSLKGNEIILGTIMI
jgi:hypothetical protein